MKSPLHLYKTPIYILAMLIFSSIPVSADNILSLSDWNSTTNPVAGTWENADSYITITNLYAPGETGGNTGGWLKISYDEIPGDIGPYYTDYIYTSADELFTGDWSELTNGLSVSFDFWASNTVPGMLQIAWHTTNASDNIWSYTLSDPSTNSWTNYVASLLYDENLWTGTGLGNESQYLADLADIDWIGIGIRRYGTGEETYGIDNFMLMVPEPAEILLLIAALITVMGSLPKRKIS